MTAQKMWQNLRDSYRRKLKTRLEKKSGDCAKREDNWSYFEAMDFLRNVLTPRESSGNINFDNQEDQSTVDLPAQIAIDEDNSNVDTICSVAEPSSHSANYENADKVSEILQSLEHRNQKSNKPTEKKAYKRSYNDNEKFLELESKKLQILSERFAKKPEKKEDDADTHFVLSLLEPMKELSSLQKMRVKIEIMNVLTRALENKAEQRSIARCLDSPALSVITNYSTTSSPLSSSICPMEESSSGVDNFVPNVLSSQYSTIVPNQYNHDTSKNARFFGQL